MNTLHILASGGTGGIEVLCEEYARYSSNNNYFVTLWGGGNITDEMKKNGQVILELNCSKYNAYQCYREILKFCVNHGIECVITHHAAPLAHLFLIGIKRKYPNIKTIAYAHGNAVNMVRDEKKKGLKFRRYILCNSLNKADAVIAISQSVKQSLINYFGVESGKISVIYNGVDIGKYNVELSAEYLNNQQKLDLVYVGRLEQVKGVQNILLALSKVNVPYMLRIVGDGSYRNELETLSGRLGIAGNVEFLGTRRDVPSLLCQSDIFIHIPDWQEGFGITVIEAMAAGCICIVNDHGALPEIVEDGVNGYVVEDINADKVAEIITNIWNRREEMNVTGSKLYSLKENAKNRAKEFSIENFTNELDKVIETL